MIPKCHLEVYPDTEALRRIKAGKKAVTSDISVFMFLFFFFISFWPYTVAFYKELTFLFSSISLWYHFVDQVLCLLALPQANLSFPLCGRFFIDKPKLFPTQEKITIMGSILFVLYHLPYKHAIGNVFYKNSENLIESRGVFAGHGSW